MHFNSVRIQSKQNKKKLLQIFARCIDSGIFFEGKENKLLIKRLEALYKKHFFITVGSGHEALSIVLSSLGLTQDDEIIFPVNAYPTAFAVTLSGAKPVPVDVDENGQIDPEELKKKVSDKTRAVVIVHLYGLVGKMEEILKIARDRKITLIEDCAQSFGTTYKKILVGSFGDFSCFSFYPTKNLASLGDGGAIATKSKKMYDLIKRAKSYGEKSKYKSLFVAGHSRLSEFQAGVVNFNLHKFAQDKKNRKRIFKTYLLEMNKLGISDYIKIMESHPESDPVHHLFVIKAKKRDNLKKVLAKNKIETHIHYPVPIHLLPAFSYLGFKKGDFPNAEKLSKEILSLPFHPYLHIRDIHVVLQNIKKVYD